MGKTNINITIFDTVEKKVVEHLGCGPSLQAMKNYIANSDHKLEENQVFSVVDESWDNQVIAYGHPDGTWEEFDPNDDNY